MIFTSHVKSIILPEVQSIIKSLPVEYDFKRYSTKIKNWLKPVIDLEEFYVYPTNGITEGLTYFTATSQNNVLREQGDYEWVDLITNRLDPPILYVSVPSSIDGNFRAIPANIPIALDLAYVGTTKIQKIPITDNVKYVFYSLSKPFGVNQFRTGWIFTRVFDPKLYNLCYKSNYYNYHAVALAESIIENFSIDYVHQKFYNKQQEVCKKFSLNPSDSVWLATSADQIYKKFVRKNVARLCITDFYRE